MTYSFKDNDLVLFKYRPAILRKVGEKCEIEFEDGKDRRVKEKDIHFLASGPVKSFSELTHVQGEPTEAWELLQGQDVPFSELAELIHGDVTASAAWSTWNLITERTFFKFNGDFNKISVTTTEEFEEEQAKKLAKEEATKRWEEFVVRLKKGEYCEQDRDFYQEVEQLAHANMKKNRILQTLGLEQSPENAHKLLLKMGIWSETHNPYPLRSGLPLTNPDTAVPELPEEEREDLTHLASFAIDDEGNQDPDDAISIDGDILWIHVADCAALVKPDSELDIVARERIANQYLPERVVTMLSPGLVDILGLGLKEISPALSFAVRVDADGNVEVDRIVASWVKVTRTTYAEADALMETKPFADIHAVTSLFRKKRERNGAAIIRLPEVKISVDENSNVAVRALPSLKSREMVTDAMLIAGEAAAKFALANGIEIPFATQQLNANLDGGDELGGMAAMFAGRKRFKRSQMKCSPGGHAGLGMDVYTRATSPMRRYLDLVVHQQLRSFINGEQVMNAEQILERVALSESVSGAVAQSERSSNQHWKLVYFIQNPEWRGKGVVVDEYNGRYTLLIPELAMDAKVNLKQPLQLNSEVELSVNRVHLPDLTAQFQVHYND